MAEQDSLVRQAIACRAFELYKVGDSRHGDDQEHWLQAEQELTILSSGLTVGVEASGFSLFIQVPLNAENSAQTMASISPWSVIFVTLPAGPNLEGVDAAETRKLVRYILLPQEVMPEQVMTSFDDESLTLRLPIRLAPMVAAQSA